jgi:glycosyltransferase involved in cell wall biosynthesis
MICQALDSVLNQAAPSVQTQLKIVVVDDGSTDNPLSAIKEYYGWEEKNGYGKLKHAFLYFIRNDEPTGPSAARNRAAQSVWEDTDAFMMLDADDLYLPNKIQKSVDKFLEDPQRIGIVYTDAVIKNLNTGTKIHEYREPFDRQRLERECIISNTPLINKVAFGKTGGYDETMRTCEDWDLWLRITEKFVAVHIPELLHVYHVTGRNSTDVVPIEVWQQNWAKIREKMMRRRNDS